MVGTSMPCTETIDGWIPGIDAQPRTPKEEINAPPPTYRPSLHCVFYLSLMVGLLAVRP